MRFTLFEVLLERIDAVEMDDVPHGYELLGVDVDSALASSCFAGAQIHFDFGVACDLQVVSNSVLSPAFIVLENVVLLIFIRLLTYNKSVIFFFIHHYIFNIFFID